MQTTTTPSANNQSVVMKVTTFPDGSQMTELETVDASGTVLSRTVSTTPASGAGGTIGGSLWTWDRVLVLGFVVASAVGLAGYSIWALVLS
ncbi:MAG: hypothetical protein AAF081_20070, partial [Actinomycetota bacterium]